MATTEVGGAPTSSLRKRSGLRNVNRGDGRDDCECRVEQCPQCQQEVVNKSMEDHLQEDCSHQVVPCKLKHAGCDFEGLRCEMAQHMVLHQPTLIFEFTKEERDKHEKLDKLVKEERDKREKLDKLVKEERDKREKLDKLVKEERDKHEKLDKLVKEERDKREKLDKLVEEERDKCEKVENMLRKNLKEERSKCNRAKVAIIIAVVSISIVYLACLEIRVKILKDSLNKTHSDVQQLMEGFCKKYIDDFIQALCNTLAGYFNLLDYFKVFRTQTTHYIEDASSSQN